MYESLLRVRLVGVSPESKLFLLRMLHHYSPTAGQTIVMSVRQTAKQFGVTDHVVTSSCRWLLEKEYVVLRSVQGRRGRAKNAYQFRTTWHEFLSANKPADYSSLHKDKVEQILFGWHQKSDIRLSNANVVLAALLFDFADECGVVEGVGYERLAKMTGMSVVRLKSQTQQLIKKGIIRTYLSGISGRHLFGRATGLFFLDIDHPIFGKTTPEATLIAIRSVSVYNDQPVNIQNKLVYDPTNPAMPPSRNLSNPSPLISLPQQDKGGGNGERSVEEAVDLEVRPRGDTESVQLFEYMRLKGGQPNPNISIFRTYPGNHYMISGNVFMYPGIDDYFDEVPGMESFLQGRLQRYASILLSRYWRLLGRSIRQGIPEFHDILTIIKNDLFPSGLESHSGHDGAKKLQDMETIAAEIYGIAYRMARAYRQAMMGLGFKIDWENMCFASLPLSSLGAVDLSMVMVMVPKMLQGSVPGFVLLVDEKFHVWEESITNQLVIDFQRYPSERELSFEQRQAYGLVFAGK